MIEECFKKAKELYDVDLSDTEVSFVNMGCTNLGQAISEDGKLSLRFNTQVPDKLLKDEIIPHEVAHLVCFRRPELGKGHDAGWKRVCESLGGVPERVCTTKLDLKPNRLYRKFLYRSSEGEDVVLTTIRHNKLQNGKVDYYLLNKKYKITSNHFLQEID